MEPIDKVLKLVKSLLEEGEMNIEIYMHDFYAIVIADGAVEKRHHIYFDKESKNE